MLDHELRMEDGILFVTPKDPLNAKDFEALAKEVDPFIESQNGKLIGIVIDVESFPGWKDFEGLIAHFNFVRDHHKDVKKVAAVTDSTFLSIMPSVVKHFVQAEVRHFPCVQRKAALHWIKGEKES